MAASKKTRGVQIRLLKRVSKKAKVASLVLKPNQTWICTVGGFSWVLTNLNDHDISVGVL